jgi:hypothetical protein
MTTFLGVMGGKLADRWPALVALPGLLFVAAVTLAAVLGQDHAVSYAALSSQINAWAASPALKSPGGAVLVVAAILAGSLVAGLAAAAGGWFIEMLWTLPGEHPPARWLAQWRRARSRRFKRIADTSLDPAAVRRAMARADRICLVEAACPTWIGDRMRACHIRIAKTYGLDLTAAWPRLWLVLPDTARTELGAARESFGGAARLTAWAVLYLLLAIWWWPAALAAVVAGVTAVVQGRLATGNFADLIESAFDLYAADLAARLGDGERLTFTAGSLLSIRMRKERWNAASPTAD